MGRSERVEWELTQARPRAASCRGVQPWPPGDGTNQGWCLLMMFQFPEGLGFLEGSRRRAGIPAVKDVIPLLSPKCSL